MRKTVLTLHAPDVSLNSILFDISQRKRPGKVLGMLARFITFIRSLAFPDLLAMAIEHRIANVHARMSEDEIREILNKDPDINFGYLLEAVVADVANDPEQEFFRRVRVLCSGQARWSDRLSPYQAIVLGGPQAAQAGLVRRSTDPLDILFFDPSQRAKLFVASAGRLGPLVPAGQDAALQIRWCGSTTHADETAQRLAAGYYPCPVLVFGPLRNRVFDRAFKEVSSGLSRAKPRDIETLLPDPVQELGFPEERVEAWREVYSRFLRGDRWDANADGRELAFTVFRNRGLQIRTAIHVA